MTIHLTTLHIPRRHLRKRKSWTIIGMFYVTLEYQPKMKNWIYNHSTGFLNYTSVLSNRPILMGLHNCSRKPLSKLLICILSAVTSYSRGGVKQMWILKNSIDLLEYIQLGPSPPALALKQLISLPSTQLFLTLS